MELSALVLLALRKGTLSLATRSHGKGEMQPEVVDQSWESNQTNKGANPWGEKQSDDGSNKKLFHLVMKWCCLLGLTGEGVCHLWVAC